MTVRNIVGLSQFQRNKNWILLTPLGVKFVFTSADDMVTFARTYWNL